MLSLQRLLSLSDQYVLIIGASGYLGAAASEVCAELGANVLLASRNIENCRNIANKLVDAGDQCIEAVKCDITLNKDIWSHNFIKLTK